MYALSHIVILYSCWHKEKQVKKREKRKRKKKKERRKREREKQATSAYRIGSAKLDEKLVGVVQIVQIL